MTFDLEVTTPNSSVEEFCFSGVSSKLHRGRPLTRQQEKEARERHGMAMNAVLEELKLVQAAEKAAVVAGSPAQQRARQWQNESGRRPAPAELAKVAASHMSMPVEQENERSFFTGEERGAAAALPQSGTKVR